MDRAALRIRSLADRRFGLLLGAMVVVALLGGYLTYTAYAAPPTATETRQVTGWESAGEFAHRATVVNGSEAFAEGEVLRDRSAYFRGATPTLDGTFEYRYTATDGGEVDADARVVLVLRSVEGRAGGNETVYWQVEDEVANGAGSLAPGDPLSVPFSVDVNAAKDRADRIESRLGGSPGELEVAIVARVDVGGTINGQAVERTRTYRLPITYAGGVYRVEDPGPVVAAGGQTETVTVPVEPGPPRRIGGPLLLAVGLAGAGGLMAARRRGMLALDEAEREALTFAGERAEFDEWISSARLPPEALPEPVVAVDSLADLVDLAIDTDRRVLEDAGDGRFVVVGERLTYVYRPPTAAGGPPVLGDPGTARSPTRADGAGSAGSAGDDPGVDRS